MQMSFQFAYDGRFYNIVPECDSLHVFLAIKKMVQLTDLTLLIPAIAK